MGHRRRDILIAAAAVLVIGAGAVVVRDDARRWVTDNWPFAEGTITATPACAPPGTDYPEAPRTGTITASGSAAWAPRSLDDLHDMASTVVVARVDSITERPPPPSASSPPMGVPMADEIARSQRVKMTVCSHVEGTKTSPTIVVFRQGGDSAQIEHDSPFSTGEQYLLFLRRRATTDGATEYIPVSIEGRYFLARNGRVKAMGTSPVSSAMDGARSTNAAMTLMRKNPPVEEYVPQVMEPSAAAVARARSRGASDAEIFRELGDHGH